MIAILERGAPRILRRSTAIAAIAAMAAISMLAGCGKKGDEAFVNRDLQKSYRETTNKDLSSLSPNPERAIQTLDAAKKQDPENAMTYYLSAAAHVKKSDFVHVLAQLKAGNAASKCVEYQSAAPAIHIFPGLARLRELANRCVEGANSSKSGLNGAQSTELLLEVRAMGTKLTHLEPLETIGPLAGVTDRMIANRGLVALYRKSGRMVEAKLAQESVDADQRWKQKAQAVVDSESPLDFGPRTLAVADKHGVTREEFRAFGQSKPLPDGAAKKIAETLLELNAKERQLAERILETLPR